MNIMKLLGWGENTGSAVDLPCSTENNSRLQGANVRQVGLIT
ncbi:hypothetical protein [uncultured Stenotrophomonas sp.]|nr:hypothetical protein [uncultured Stenotrophomonas sp.]